MMEKLNPEQRAMRTLTTIQKDFRLSAVPHHIECFDNSNISGTNPVAACVVFRNAKPSKKNIATSTSRRWKAPTTMLR